LNKVDPDDFDQESDVESEIAESDIFAISYFDVNGKNVLGQTPIFQAITKQNTEMFNLLIQSKSDITKKELMHNESVRDSVFRYCPEEKTDFLSIDHRRLKS